MKRNFIMLMVMLLTLMINNLVVAQNNSNEKNNFCAKEDDIIIDAFYGWPYFNGAILKSISNANHLERVRNTNHLGGKAEIMISDEIGLGGEFTYADANIRYQSGTTGFYETAGISKIRVLGRFNYHFATTEDLDPYATIGAGYKRTTYYDSGSSTVSQSPFLIPVSFKLAVGLRVYFSDMIGINAEIGLGGPLIAAGLTVKI